MPSVHAPQGPGGYPGPFSVVDATTAIFAGQEPMSVPLEMARGGGATISVRGEVANIQTALGIDFVSATKGWVVGEANGPHRWHYFIESTLDGGRKWSVQYERQF
jgi:hypothetical protein